MDHLPALLAAIMPALLVLFGIAVKRFPFLKDVPNNLIPWFNLALALLVKIAAPVEAHAGGFVVPVAHALGWLWPPLQVVLARLIYETFLRPTEDLTGHGAPPAVPTKP